MNSGKLKKKTFDLTVGCEVVCENGVSFLSCAAVNVECIGDILC